MPGKPLHSMNAGARWSRLYGRSGQQPRLSVSYGSLVRTPMLVAAIPTAASPTLRDNETLTSDIPSGTYFSAYARAGPTSRGEGQVTNR